MKTIDTVIIGAGLIGSGLALGFAELGFGDVCVIDPDLEGTFSSSELNAGGVRATWNQPLNVEAAQLTIDFFSRHVDETGYRPLGYLWLHDAEAMRAAESRVARWQAAGWPVETWSIDELRRQRPFLDRTEDLAGAVFASRDGLVNPNLLKNFYREVAKRAGISFRDRLLLVGATEDDGGFTLEFLRLPAELTREQKERIFSANPGDLAAEFSRETVRAQRVVNCAGAWAGAVAKTLGYASPAYAIRRQICLFDCRDVDLTPYGMTVDSSGVYFHPESTYVLAGIADRDEQPGFRFDYGGEEFFQEKIWLPLAERSSKFERLRHVTGWGGLYEVSPDESAIIGEVDRVGGKKGVLYESHSYSGHGVMHSYATGRALAEQIVEGRARFLDVAPFSGARFREGRLLLETAVI